MKSIITTFTLLIICIYANGQTLNEQLYQAVKAKNSTQVGLLLDKGADANYKAARGEFQLSLLIVSVNNQDIQTVKLLVDHNAEINWKDWFKTTALMYAAQKGNVEIISYLLKHGADIHAHDDQGNTVLTAAKEGNHPEAIKLIEDNLRSN